jgi:heat-inducible transcriptional repressor
MVNMHGRETPSEDFLSALNGRSQDIFRKLVERYLATGSPVGSRDLSRMLSVGLSPATVRNVMSDLEDLGLIASPHTSAGRLPTQRGLRFFVDAMLEVGAVNEAERKAIETQIAGPARAGHLEDLLTEASQLLSGLSHGAGVVIAQKSDLVLKHIEFVRLDAERAMVVLVGEDGTVENRVVQLPAGLTASALTQASNYLAHLAVGRTLGEIRQSLEAQRLAMRSELDALTRKLVEDGVATVTGPRGAGTPTVIVRGRANLINDTMASDELRRVRELFEELESRDGLIELLGDTESAQGVKIFIGSENKLFALSGSSVILSPYTDGGGKVVGVLGVIGPTRINYARIVPVVDYTAGIISQIIGRKSTPPREPGQG